MSVKGKKKNEYVAVTYCDFGQEGRREPLVHHYSLAAAFRRYRRVWEIYGATSKDQKGCKVWIEVV